MNVKDICTDARLTLENALKQTRERHAELFSKAHGGRVPTFAKKEIELAFAFAETKTLAAHLLEARTRLRSLFSRCEKLPAQRPRGLSTETPRSHLPLEVIQYIISLAYEGERQAHTRDGDELDFRDYPVAMGATSLGTDVHPMHKALLSSTLICFSDLGHGIFRRAKTPRLKNVSESKYRIAFGSATTTPDATRIVEHLARRITSLVVRTGSQLKCCAASIPYITEFIYLCGTSHPKAYEPDFAWLRAAVQRSEKRSIRIASVPSTLLTDFVSTGLFDGVNDLCVDHNPKVFARTSLLGITELLDTICHCDKLVSLELRLQGYFEYVGMGSRRPISILEWTESDVRGRLPPLRSLNLSGNNWYELQRLIWKFSFCDLTELAFTSFLKESFLGDPSLFCLNLSASFPNLEIFRMTTSEVRKVLYTPSGDAESGSIWNFPRLHTLDIRGAPLASSEQLAEVVTTLRERADFRSSCPGSRVVAPINCFCMDLKELQDDPKALFACRVYRFDEHLEKLLGTSEYLLLRLELGQIVPNLVCNVC